MGGILTAVGLLALIWVFVVWRWQDPFTALYTMWEQHKLAQQLRHEMTTEHVQAESAGAEARAIELAATRFRHTAGVGQAIGRIIVPRLGLNMVVVNSTDDASLERGPGRDLRTFMPGQDRLVYIAGHRTTFLAPFSHIDAIRTGDPIKLEMPYGTFAYRAVRHMIVPADDLGVLKSPPHELLALQACNPRFFATQRYIVYARLVKVEARNGRLLAPSLLAAASRNNGR